MDSLRHELARFIQSPAARHDPPRLYRRLLTEAPVLDLGRVTVVSGYDEIVTVLMHPGTVVDPAAVGIARPGTSRLAEVVARMLPLRDGADHSRLKRLATAAFSARRLDAIRGRITDTAERLLEPLLAAGSFDMVADFAVPLPVAVSCAILDIPEHDRHRVTGWAALVARSLLDPHAGPEETAAFDAEFEEFRDYVEELCARRAADPGDDLISKLTVARAAGKIDSDDLLAFVVMLLANGLETLTSGLAVAVWHSLTTPGALDLVRDRPETAEAVFDECQRLGSPVRASARALTGDVPVAGTVLPAGTVTLLLYAAANRDPRRFPDPDRFDPARAERRHLAFGHGPHHCLGAPLSLMAGGAVLRLLAAAGAERTVSTPLTEETAPWSEQFVFGGLRSLPILSPRRAVDPAPVAAPPPYGPGSGPGGRETVGAGAGAR
ncbi:Cytochrome P450 [Actinacidiphila alni]|uniref:Cytochrome P450 n=1 Tax=Actinacidiphila alni TaxID=380248 RepID=A0A1I2LSG1_9ACTN|nr:cytochrome P450 [Actinacidiphila alni]SFF81389.1 Cytochrome P450 [Actinacidiphila alni]